MVDTGLRVLVVGAGIAGLATARTLRLAGFRPDVVDALPAATAPTAGLYLPGNGARALRAIGLHEAVRPCGAVVTRQRFCSSRGEVLAEIDVTRLWAGVGECRGLSRADLHRILLSGAGGEVRYETEVTGLEIADGCRPPAGAAQRSPRRGGRDSQATVKAEFAGGRRAEYDLVVGADGRRSAARRLTGLGGPARPVGQLGYRAVVCGGPAVDACVTLLGQGTSFLAVPIGGGRVHCYVDDAAGAPDSPGPGAGRPRRAPAPPAPPEDPLARVRELLAGFGGPVPGLLEQVEKVQVATIEEVDLPAWSRGPVVLAGDAAHACSPEMAQGAAMALEDAVVLAEELRRAATVPEALAAYEARRLPRTAWVLAQARRRARTRSLPPAVRHALLRRRGEAIFRGYYEGLIGAP